MYLQLYCEINIICFIILSVILYKEHRSIDKQMEQTAFTYVIVSIMITIAIDTLWIIVEGNSTLASSNTLLNIAYMIMTGLVGYFWLQFTNCKLKRFDSISTVERAIIVLPLIALIVIAVATPWTGWLFYIDAQNRYHRSDLFIIQLIISYGYMLYAAGEALIFFMREKSSEKRSEYGILAAFSILPLIGGILQTLFYGIPAEWPAATLSIFMVYISFQSKQISTDSLTGLNNRGQMDKYINSHINETRTGEKMYFLLMDINSFKEINDNYGHLEGDKVLTIVSAVLKNVCEFHNSFVARYGGDEFAAVIMSSDDNQILTMMEDIKNELCIFSNSLHIKHPITLSMGYSVVSVDSEDPVKLLIRQADEKMYADKAKYREAV